jgi:ferredoxin
VRERDETMGERYEVEVRPDLCTATQMCISIDPDTFEFDGEVGVSRPRRTPVEATEDVMDAAENCPVEAIVIRDAASGEQLFP